MNTSLRWLDPLLISAFCFALLYSLWSATVGWGTPIVQQYEFVQAKAAITTYYIAQGGPILRYELPVMGPPWSVPYEFPFYQVASAWTHNLTGMPLEAAGRIVAKIFFYLSCIPLFLIARVLGFTGRTPLVPVTLFLASPIYLYWSRQFMNESTATFFGLAYLATAMLWTKNPGNGKWLLALVFGVAAALAKSTTYSTFGLAAGIFLSYQLFRAKSFSFAAVTRALTILVVPLVAGLLWVRYTDGVKLLNPLAADTHTSAALSQWYLSSNWVERMSGNLWYHFFRITLHDAIGHRAVWILSLFVAVYLGKRAWLYWLCSCLFLVAPLLFTHAHLLHDYYANANAVFLVFAAAVLVERAIASEKKWGVWLGTVFFVLVIGYEVRDFMGKGYLQQQERRMPQIDFAKKLQGIVAPGDVMLMYGEDWCPVIPYYAERRAIMMQNSTWYNPRLAESLALLKQEGKRVSVTVLCHEARTDEVLKSRISLGPLLLRDTCDVYAYR